MTTLLMTPQAYQSPYVKSLQLPKPEFKTETTAAAAAANVQDGCYDSSSLYVNTRLEGAKLSSLYGEKLTKKQCNGRNK